MAADLKDLPQRVLTPLAGFTTAAGARVLERANDPQWAQSLGPLVESGRSILLLLRRSSRAARIETAVTDFAENPQSPSNATALLAAIGQVVERDAALADALTALVEKAPGPETPGFTNVTVLNSPHSIVGNNNTSIVGLSPEGK
ncbi:hypothetical protein [Actinoplanes utahensis]|uniref:Uncharacterized protein n=1 Tax=Actinoplanes utahensis TaxID=1869 RepID=A0A0A6XBV1_ACTUT|nr:hypothetical protein [Actinoplanes utahensis]KHD77592.1 hypothetical protein MB27_10985 [Actinoplanes utahensis]GIF32789.1 hypothetical protein Aut01nite_57750 [Actinoplanes utahensis]